MFYGSIVDNIYFLDLDDVSRYGTKYLVSKNVGSWLWHIRLGCVHFDLINRIVSKNLVVGQPNIKFSKDKICDACQIGNQTRVSFKSKNVISTSKHLDLLHLGLFGHSRTKSIGGNYYGFVIIDDFRFT